MSFLHLTYFISIMSLKLIHVSLLQNFPAFLKSWIAFHCYVYTVFHFIHSFVDGQLVCFHISAIVDNAFMNIGIQIPVWDPAFSSFGIIPRSGIAQLCNNSVFNFFEEHDSVFHSVFHFTYLPMVYMVLNLMFKFLIHFLVNFFVYSLGSAFMLYHMNIQLFQYCLLKDCSFPIEWSWYLYWI